MDSSQLSTQRRRSERISKSLPLIVRGFDLLGQPFEERTSTVILNLHGCRYLSKHHLPKNTWVTLELPQDAQRGNLRARVAWIQRPHSVREFFQIAVELESPANIWSVESPPADWEMSETSIPSPAEFSTGQGSRIIEEFEADKASEVIETSTERTTAEMTNPPSDFVFSSQVPASSTGQEPTPDVESPLLREWKSEMERLASRAAETAAAQAVGQIHRSMEEFERAQNAARESASRLTQELLQLESEQAARFHQQSEERSKETTGLTENAAASWRERLAAEMALAQAQWNELLQSSLDGGVERLVAQLSGRSQDVLRDAEQKMSERIADLRQPLSHLYSEARETLSGIKSALEQEVGRARFSLSEIENAASRMKEYSAQLEAASHDTLNELHRRLENILEAQSDELNRRAEGVVAAVPQRLAPTLDSLGHQFMERTMAEVDSKLAPRLERIPELLRELASREVEGEESLRLHRERLRQISENSQREVAAQMGVTLASLRQDFESARKEALTKWTEELDTSGVRATHAASESIGRSSEWFQQEARARLQVLVEQALVTAGSGLEEKTAEGTRQFEAKLEAETTDRLSRIQQQLDGVAGEITGRTRTRLDAAAETAAASFGHVLRDISDQEVGQFTTTSRGLLQEREEDLKRFTGQVVGELESSAGGLTDRFRAELASQLQTSIAEGRSALAAEFASALDRYRAERDAHDKEWSVTLDRVSEEATEKYQDRLEAVCDSLVVSSVRRLNEHGQNVIESLMRSADQSLRDSCSKVFEGLSEMLQERAPNAAGVAGFTPGPNREPSEPPSPHNLSASRGASA